MRAEAYQTFTRTEWAALRANTPLTLTHDELASLRGVNDRVSLDELADVYLPLSRLLNLHVRAARNLNGVTDTFLGRPIVGRTYVIAVAGSGRLASLYVRALGLLGHAAEATDGDAAVLAGLAAARNGEGAGA